MCSIRNLPDGKIFKGIIIKEKFGHKLHIDWINSETSLEKLKESLTRAVKLLSAHGIILEIVEEIKADKKKLRNRILELNKKANLPGINKISAA